MKKHSLKVFAYAVKAEWESGYRLVSKNKTRAIKYAKGLQQNGIKCEVIEI